MTSLARWKEAICEEKHFPVPHAFVLHLFAKLTHPHITDGTSKTFLFGETTQQLANTIAAYNGDGNWGWIIGPNDPLHEGNDKVNGFGSDHPGVTNFAFCDSSARSINNNTSIKILQALITRAGGEVVGNF